MKNVVIYTTSGQSKTVETSAATWGELQRMLDGQNIGHSGMKAVIGETRNTLESSQAMLPEGDFTLFLMPKKTKSGMAATKKLKAVEDLEYTELKTEVKQHIADWGDEAKTHFNKDKSWNTKKEGELQRLLKAWRKKKDGKEPTKAAPKKAATKKADTKETKVVTKRVAGFTKNGPVAEEIIEEDDENEIEESNAVKKAVKQVKAEVQKELSDIKLINGAIKMLKEIKNTNCQTKLGVALVHLDDTKYVIATGKPRIDPENLRRMADELRNDSNLDFRR